MTLPLESAPKSICILRLSAVGDICHALPVVRTLQQVWPETHITWVIGKLEHTLVGDIPGIEFIVFDKSEGMAAYRNLRQIIKGKQYDVLLHMQMSLRASLASLLIPTKIRLGFDRHRAKDLQWLFTNHKIAFVDQQHVMDSLFGFIEALGIDERRLEWNIPLSEQVIDSVSNLLPQQNAFMVISPCSSMSYRNWTAAGYAAVADYAAEKYGLSSVITGGSSEIEKEFGALISAHAMSQPLNLVGQTNLKQLLAILQQARCVLAPDSGPAHMATAVATPVIGLYATTNPDRARAYLSADWVVNHYPEAVRDKFGKTVAQLPWGTRVRDAGTMDRIKVEDVTSMLDKLMQH